MDTLHYSPSGLFCRWSQNRISKVTHKCGVELLISVSYSKKLDEKNGSTLWIDVTSREIDNSKVSFDILEDVSKIPVGHDKASSHLVFDARVTFEHKTTWVKDGCRTP